MGLTLISGGSQTTKTLVKYQVFPQQKSTSIQDITGMLMLMAILRGNRVTGQFRQNLNLYQEVEGST